MIRLCIPDLLHTWNILEGSRDGRCLSPVLASTAHSCMHQLNGGLCGLLQYDYRTGGEHRKKHALRHKDASGRDEPYDPDWGNYGTRRLSCSSFPACMHKSTNLYTTKGIGPTSHSIHL